MFTGNSHATRLPGPVDGVFGDKTEGAVVQFQEEHSLYSDGIVGPNTWGMLHRALEIIGGAQMELSAVTYGSRNQGKSVSGRFIDLTDIFEKEGFKRIRARRSFFTGGNRLGAEWWPFNTRMGLEQGISTFGDELLKVYSEEQLTGTPPWRYRNRLFRVDWF